MHQVGRVLQRAADRQRRQGFVGRAGELQQALHHLLQPPAGLLDGLRRFKRHRLTPRLRRFVLRLQAAAQDLGVGDDGGQRVIDLVGHPGRHFTDGGHARRLHQVGLGRLHLGFQQLVLGDIPPHRLELEDAPALVEDGPVGALQPAQPLARQVHLVLQGDHGALGTERAQVLDQARPLLLGDEEQEVHPLQLFARLAKIAAVDLVDEGQRAAGLEAADQLGLVVFHDGPVARLALAQRLLGLELARDVVRDVHVAQRLGWFGALQAGDARADPDGAPIAVVALAHGVGAGLVAVARLGDGRAEGGQVELRHRAAQALVGAPAVQAFGGRVPVGDLAAVVPHHNRIPYVVQQQGLVADLLLRALDRQLALVGLDRLVD